MALSKIKSNSIEDAAITATQIATDAVDSAEIAADAVGTSEIAANAVAASELADDAVDTAAIADDAVTGAKVALFDDSLAATTTHFLIADGTDYSSFALSGDVTSTNAGAVTIADNAVTLTKLADGTQGQIVYYGASGSPTALAVGTSGQRLLSGGASANLSWSDQDGKNIVINGGMEVWQRGVSFATASYYQWYADRWNGDAHNSSEFTVTQITGTTVAAVGTTPFSSALRFQRNASSTEVNNRRIGTVFETAMSRGLAGKTVTLSFYARQGANGSITNTVYSYIFIGTGVNESASSGLGSGWTGYVAQNQGNTITTSWVRFTQTVTLSASTNQLGIQFTAQAAAGTAGADDTWDISGIKLEVGSEATPFFDENPGQEMAACQRYFEKSYNLTTVPGTAGVQGGLQYSTNNAVILTQSPGAVFKVTKRTTPTIVVYNAVSGVSGETYRASDASSQTTTLSHIGEAAIGYLNVPSSNNGYLYHYTADSEL